MKILFSTRPAYGHVYPLIPLALTAREAGHEVSFATTGSFLHRLGRLGFPTHDVGLTIDEALESLAASMPGDGMPKRDDGRPDLDAGSRLFSSTSWPAARPTTWRSCSPGCGRTWSCTSSTSSGPPWRRMLPGSPPSVIRSRRAHPTS